MRVDEARNQYMLVESDPAVAGKRGSGFGNWQDRFDFSFGDDDRVVREHRASGFDGNEPARLEQETVLDAGS